jgi:hypothetical protein
LAGCSEDAITIASKDVGPQWPFTVPEVRVACAPTFALFISADGKAYPLNGQAERHPGLSGKGPLSKLSDIWKVDPEISKLSPDTRMSLDAFTHKAIEACAKAGKWEPSNYSRNKTPGRTAGFDPNPTSCGPSTPLPRNLLRSLATRSILQRADDLGCCCLEFCQVASGKFLYRKGCLDPKNVDRAVYACAIQQGHSNRCQSIVYRRVSVGPPAEAAVTDPISPLTSLPQNLVEPLGVARESILGFFGLGEFLQNFFPLLP